MTALERWRALSPDQRLWVIAINVLLALALLGVSALLLLMATELEP